MWAKLQSRADKPLALPKYFRIVGSIAFLIAEGPEPKRRPDGLRHFHIQLDLKQRSLDAPKGLEDAYKIVMFDDVRGPIVVIIPNGHVDSDLLEVLQSADG